MRGTVTLTALLAIFGWTMMSGQITNDSLRSKAEKLSRQIIIVDTHIDAPEQLRERWQDLSTDASKCEFDYPRARAGGLSAPFLSIYVPAEEEKAGTAKKTADMLIDMIEKLAKSSPRKFAIAVSPSDVRRNFKAGRISLCMGMENGAPLESEADIQHFYKRGIRYVTLTHALDNHISDSSFDTTHTWHGLSPFGKKLVVDLNRAGIMVDISHVSDEAFYQVMDLSVAPVIASHSSCRAFTPGFERNMSDDMIKLLAEKGGVIQINFGSDFLSQTYRDKQDAARKEIAEYLHTHNLQRGDSAARAYAADYRKEHPIRHAALADVVAHIDHVVKLVGIDHVGIGSDFDGVGDTLPIGLEDVSKYPNLIYFLLKSGYSEEDIRKICGENLLRVWVQVQKVPDEMKAAH